MDGIWRGLAFGVAVCLCADGGAADEQPSVRLDTGSAMAFLEHVTGELPADEEKTWWDIGRYQHGPDARRYHIAFAGYAAAALSAADPSLRARAGKVLSACLSRMLRRDVWAYSQSPKRWG